MTLFVLKLDTYKWNDAGKS